MKASELRIGNLVWDYNVLHPTEKYVSVLLIIPHGLIVENSDGNYAIPSDKLKPILLTEEWLLKFGFEKDIDDLCLNLNNAFLVWYNDDEFVYYMSNNLEILASLKYVHQIQNLYFALTGEELTIKD